MKRGVRRPMAAPVTIEHPHLSNYPMKLTACGRSALNSCPRSHAAAYGGRYAAIARGVTSDTGDTSLVKA